MTDTIVVKLDDLLERVQSMKRDGMTCVELFIMDKEEFNGDQIPKNLSLCAYSDDPDFQTDYDTIEEIQK